VQIDPGLHKLLANYQTGGYNFRPMSGWNGKIGSHSSVSERTPSTHSRGYVSRSRDFTRFTCPIACSVTSDDEIRSRGSTVSN